MARFYIGNHTTQSARPMLAPYDYAVTKGFDAFEWVSDKGGGGWAESDFDSAARASFRQVGAERGIRFSVHAPFAADPCNADGANAIYRSLDFAADVRAAVVNVHLFPQHGAERFIEALRPLLARARRLGVRISLENTPETTPDHFNAVFAGLANVPEASVAGMCLDMGHANLCAGTRNDYLNFVDRLGAHVPIIHWHAHENWGDRDSHLPLFTGPAGKNDAGVRGLVRRLAQRGFDGSVVMEQWPSPPEVLVRTRERLQALIGEELTQAR
jgi:sugar phosphate isomerase/epimerase